MNNIILSLRDAVEDASKYTSDSFEFITSKIFTLSEANIDSANLVCYKNGELWLITPIAGASVAWTRTGTVITITKTAHGFITGDTATISVTSDESALPLGAKLVTKLTDNTFTVVGLNAGTSSGTCSYTVVANYSYNFNNGKLIVTGNLTIGNILEFTYYAHVKYSDNELRGYIRSALGYLAVEKYRTFVARSDNTIYPTPSQDEVYLISAIASIIIKGTIKSYKTPEITVVFSDNLSKEDKILNVIRQFSKNYGALSYIDLDERSTTDEDC